MRVHNFVTVLTFEVRRTLLKPQFWLATLAVPALFALFTALVWASGSAAGQAVSNVAGPVPFTYADASGVIRPDVAERLGGRPTTDADADAEAVRQGRADLFISYPADPLREPVTVVGRDLGLTDVGSYHVAARTLLRQSASAGLSDQRLAALATASPSVVLTTYKDGAPAPGWAAVVAPGLFLLLLYLSVLMLGNQMLNITVEEKENRVTEMILTALHPTTLIVGKVAALLVVGLVQTAVVGVPVMTLLTLAPGVLGVAGGAVAGSGPALTGLGSGVGLAGLSPWPLVLGALLFVGGLLMFAGVLVAIGAVMPTAKDASGAFGIVMLAMFLPAYAAGYLLAEPESLVSRALTFFPLTAPVTALLRNALGSLGPVEGVASLAVILVSAGWFLALGVRLFRQGSLSYGVRLPWRSLLAAVRQQCVGRRR